MGLEQVVQQILAEGKDEASSIEEAARQEAAAIGAEARQEAEKLARQKATEAEHAAESRARRITAAAQLEGKKLRLNAQADVLATIRSRVEDRLVSLPASERAELLAKVVEGSSAGEFGKGANAWGRKEDQEAIEELGFTYAGEIECLGGVVVESPDGTMREDIRFDAILDEVWRENVHAIAKKAMDG